MSKADDEIALLVTKFDNMSLEYRNAQCLFEITVQLIRLNEKIEETRMLLDIPHRPKSKSKTVPPRKTAPHRKSKPK
jgi:hypothetical protein